MNITRRILKVLEVLRNDENNNNHVVIIIISIMIIMIMICSWKREEIAGL